MTELAAIRDGLIRRTGHHYYLDKDKLLQERFRERMLARDVKDVRAYAALLDDPENGEAEWRALEDAITIGETYFFRYSEQFDLLRTTILPGLIASRSDTKSLRIWSVGCSNGAEPYSVAIVVREVLGKEFEDWRISITGGDISEAALKRAESGLFGPWALRALSEETVNRYFDPAGPRTWLLKRDYCSMVRFERQNILDLLSPAAPLQWTDFDIIFCRNVLIYFSPEAAVRLVASLRSRVAPGGSLILGHAEAGLTSADACARNGRLSSEFQTALSPELMPPPITLAWPATGLDGDREDAVMRAARNLPAEQARASADDIASDSGAGDARSLDEDIELLKRLADSGNYSGAVEVSSHLLARPDVPPLVYYLKAVLCQVVDDIEGAQSSLRQALYLDRNFVLAHHRLGLLALASGRAASGLRSMQTAVRLASRLPKEQELLGGDGLRAGEFVAMAGAQSGSAATS